MSDTFLIFLIWVIAFSLVSVLISILVYFYYRNKKFHDLVLQYIIDNPKEVIRILNRYYS